jgi:glyoxylase-like metal-dependent hydrolase (beta-lactamase superfamily II)
MIFRQMFDSVSGTYSYLVASRRGGEALIIDPVLEKVDRYAQLLHELDLKLVKAIDTHLHANTSPDLARSATAPIASPSWASRARWTSSRCGSLMTIGFRSKA